MKVSGYAVGLCLSILQLSAFASGEDTYKAVCMNCHSKKFVNSPQVGDRAMWAPLIKEGQVTLTAHGYVGVRSMPAKGGKPDLSVPEFSEALVYMVNQSGGKWKTPDAKTMSAIYAEIAAREKVKR